MTGYPLLRDCAFLSDCHTAALVGPDGAVEWLCLPRFDGPSVFARLLDRERGGALALTVEGAGAAERAYRPGTLVLDSRYAGDGGAVRVVDFFAVENPVGRDQPAIRARHMLVRLVRCERGSATIRLHVDARPGYAADGSARWRPQGDAVLLEGGEAWLSSTLGLELEADCAVTGHAELRAGDEAAIVLGYDGAPAPIDAGAAERLLTETEACWRGWSELAHYGGPGRDQVAHSAVVLRGLLLDETGALLAAPTSSLPECPGGTRNWDYRYTWHRDAALLVLALLRLGHEQEARQYLDFLLHCASLRAERLAPMADLDGADAPDETALDHLEGYERSRPVRVGNGAHSQFQLDVYGHVLDAAFGFQGVTGRLRERDWELLRTLADECCEAWREPDHGIWEVRGEPRHYTYSKVMAWVCLDRAIRLAEALDDEEADADRWASERDAIHADVLEHGWSDERGSFVHWYGSNALDAALVRIPLVSFLPGDDGRVLATLERVIDELGDGPALVRRYDHEETGDGFEEGEAPFLLCSFDVVSALVLAGRRDEARERFEELCGAVGPLRNLAEEMTADGRLLGNHPQAFSHLALIEAALNLDAGAGEDELHAWAEREAGPVKLHA